MKRLIIMICLAFILMILAVKADDIAEQYNIIIKDMHDDINDTFNSLIRAD